MKKNNAGHCGIVSFSVKIAMDEPSIEIEKKVPDRAPFLQNLHVPFVKKYSQMRRGHEDSFDGRSVLRLR